MLSAHSTCALQTHSGPGPPEQGLWVPLGHRTFGKKFLESEFWVKCGHCLVPEPHVRAEDGAIPPYGLSLGRDTQPGAVV